MRKTEFDKLPRNIIKIPAKGGKSYWYYNPHRVKRSGNKLIRLPEYGTPDWQAAIAQIQREQDEADSLFKDDKLVRNEKHAYNIRVLVADYRSISAWRRLSRGTKITYNAALSSILSAWRHRDPADIHAPDVLELVEKLSEKPAMANMVLLLSKKLFKFAIQKGLRKDNPAREIDRLVELGDSAKPLSPAAWAALMAPECPQPVHRLGILGRFTGQRISDLVRMQPLGRDEDGIKCTIKKQNYQDHWCLLTDEQAATIDGWCAPATIPYICRPDGRPYTTAPLRNLWKAFASTNQGAALKGFSPHDLRATKVCDERISGKTHQQIAAIVGMTIDTVMHYSRKIDQRLAAKGPASQRGQPTPQSAGPLGKIYDLDEAAAYLRVDAEHLAIIAKTYGIGAMFGRTMRFHEADVRALWEHAKPNPIANAVPAKQRSNWRPGWRQRHRDRGR